MVWWISPASFVAGGTGLLVAASLSTSSPVREVYVILSIIIGLSVLAILAQIFLRRSIRSKTKDEKKKDEENVDDEWGWTGWSPNQDFDDEASESTGWALHQKKMLEQTDEKLRPSSITIIIIMVPSILFFIVLFLRLAVGEDHFQGNASKLDFGPLDGIEGSEPNVSFGKGNTNAVWHALQGGFASLFAFPAIARVLMGMCCGRCDRIILGITELGAAALTFYPGYYLVRYFFEDDQNFATSSYVSNAFEWACGYCMGMAVAFLITAFVQRNLLVNGDEYESKHGKNRVMVCYGPIKIIHFMFGTLMLFTLFASGVLFGTTWNTCVADETDCVNYSTNKEAANLIGSLFVVIPAVVICATVLRERCRYR